MILEEKMKQFEGLQTPFYFYDLDLLRRTLRQLKTESDKYQFEVHYAMKANANVELLKIINEFGLGADCVSGNEVKHALKNNFIASKIVFAGVGKNDVEISLALDADISCFNVESIQELEIINELAWRKNKIAAVALRINPNVNAYTHHYITTGLEENKFGINEWELPEIIVLLNKLSNIKLIGIHFHVGSLINDLTVFKNLCTRVNYFITWFDERKINLESINVGGGLGVDYYHPDENPFADFKNYFMLFHNLLELKPTPKVHFELGRAIVAQCGTLISKVLYIKKGIKTNFAILDAGMTELLRPALYQSYHKIENLSRISEPKNSKYDVVGPICESSDCFGKSVELPHTQRGDIIALRTTGAYGEVMTSQYNLREKVKSIYTE